MLPHALNAIARQDFPSSRFELIVVDDTASGQNKKVTDSFKGKITNLIFISPGHQGAAKARIKAFAQAKGDIIAFTDEDTLPKKDWLSQIKKAFDAHPEAAGIEGKVYTDTIKPLFSNAPENLHGGIYIGCNTHYRRAVLEKVNYYDPEFYFWREDTNLAFKALTQGKIIFVPEVVTHHPAKSIAPVSLWKNLHHLKDDMLLFRRFPQKTVSFVGREWIRHAGVSAMAWLLVLAGYALDGWIGLALGIIIYGIFRTLLNLQKKRFTFKEGAQFLFITFVRDLAFPFYFVYYLITVNVFNTPDFSPRMAQ